MTWRTDPPTLYRSTLPMEGTHMQKTYIDGVEAVVDLGTITNRRCTDALRRHFGVTLDLLTQVLRHGAKAMQYNANDQPVEHYDGVSIMQSRYNNGVVFAYDTTANRATLRIDTTAENATELSREFGVPLSGLPVLV